MNHAYNIDTMEITDTRSGMPHLLNNIELVNKLRVILETSLGPYGMDKVFIRENEYTATNDGATILQNLRLEHPVENFVRSISRSQDIAIGDGTTSIIILLSEMLNNLRPLIERGVKVTAIKGTMKNILKVLLDELKNIAFPIKSGAITEGLEDLIAEETERRIDIKNFIKTPLNSKILAAYSEHFTNLLSNITEKDTLIIKEIVGGSLGESFLINGVFFERTFSYAGFEQQPKNFGEVKILCCDIEMEMKAERENAEIIIDSVEKYELFYKAEQNLFYSRLMKIVEAGIKIVLSEKPIGDYATQFFAKHNIFCSGRVNKDDIKNIALNCNTLVYSSYNFFKPGIVKSFKEEQIGNEFYNILNFKETSIFTLVLKGPDSELIEEAKRTINDAHMILKRTLEQKYGLYGGGYTEMYLSFFIKNILNSVDENEVAIYKIIGKSLEIIPFILANNFGFSGIEILSQMRYFFTSGKNVFISENGLQEVINDPIYEPLALKENIFKMAFCAIETILSIDGTFVVQRSE